MLFGSAKGGRYMAASHPLNVNRVSGRLPSDGSSNQEWQGRASCRGPNHAIFFPPSRLERRTDKRRREARAKEICQECPVMEQCLSYAISIREQHGIWGGLTARERKDLALTS